MISHSEVNQARLPNFSVGDKFFLMKCFKCNPDEGLENYVIAVARGYCAWCGWGFDKEKLEK